MNIFVLQAKRNIRYPAYHVFSMERLSAMSIVQWGHLLFKKFLHERPF